MTPAIKELVSHSIDGLTHDNVSLSLFEARKTSTPAGAPPRANVALVPGVASQQVWLVLLFMLVAAVIALAFLPGLLRKRGLDWRRWVRDALRPR